MNDEFLRTLPWRLASLTGLIVGIVSFATAAVDVWSGLVRIGIAFMAFFVIGAIARTLLATSSEVTLKSEANKRRSAHLRERQPLQAEAHAPAPNNTARSPVGNDDAAAANL